MELSRLNFSNPFRLSPPSKAVPPPASQVEASGDEFLRQSSPSLGDSPSAGVLRKQLAGLSLALAGALAMGPAVAAQAEFGRLDQLDSQGESQLLRDAKSCGKLVKLQEGQADQGLHLTIHGLGAAPKDMAPFTTKAQQAGQTTATFAYNTLGCDHEQNTQALASELRNWVAEHPGKPLTIETHSMGGRMILGAFHHLQKAGDMPSHAIQLNMVAPPLAGFALFNLCLAMPPAVARLIPGAAATRDMASLSTAQGQLDDLRLPSNVKTSIFYGGDDSLIDYTQPGAARMAGNLQAQVYYLAGKGHYEVAEAVARGEKASQEPVEYLPAVRARAQELH